MSKFKVGDRVYLAKPGPDLDEACESEKFVGRVLVINRIVSGDCPYYAENMCFYEHELEHEAVYNSPLYKALL
jgi:hypothetical protein